MEYSLTFKCIIHLISSRFSVFFKRIIICLAILLLLRANSFSQTPLIDSLLRTLENHKTEDTIRAWNYLRLGEEFEDYDLERSISYLKKSLELSKRLNYPESTAGSMVILGRLYGHKNDIDSAHHYFQLGENFAEENQMLKWLSNVYNEWGIIESYSGNYEEAIRILQKGIPIAEKLGNKKVLSRINSNIAGIFFEQENYQMALEYELKGYHLFKKEPDKRIVVVLTNIGQEYGALGKNDSALYYLRSAITEANHYGDQTDMVFALGSMGDQYNETGLTDSALYYYESVMQMYNKYGIEDMLKGSYLTSLGGIYYEKKEYEKALRYQLESEKLLNEENNVSQLEQTLLDLSKTYAGLGNYSTAYSYMQRYTALHDTLASADKTNAVAELERKFSLKQKQEEIDILNKEKQLQEEEAQQQRLLKNIFIGGAVLLLFIAFLLWNRFRLKKRTSKQLEEKNIIIQKEKERADEQRNRAEMSEQFKSQFLANMSHEIRTPMNAIMGITNLLMEEENEEKRIKYLSAIKKSSENLLVILNDILDLSKLEAGKVELEKIPFRTHDPFDFVYETFRAKAEGKKLIWKLSVDNNLPQILVGDPARLTQVLLNLVGNAMKFTEKGSVEMRVNKTLVAGETEAESSICLLNISVIDTGIGIPKEKVSDIFQTFTQANSSDNRKYGGTGLGLSISKTLVELMNGTINVKSEHGAGSTFTFTIPLQTGTEEQLLLNQKQELGFGEDIGEELRGLHILVAEDNEYNQMLISDTLQKFIPDVKVLICNNGKEVIQQLTSTNSSSLNLKDHVARFDIILMDIQMPEMDGYETTSKIRMEMKSEIPIIALTASVIRSDIDKCMEAGMNTYVSKPFDEVTLLYEIAKVLGKNSNAPINGRLIKSEKLAGFESQGTLISLEKLKSQAQNDPVRINKYLRIFLELVPQRIHTIETALESQDWMTVRKTVHSIKPQLNTLGLLTCKQLADDIEVNYHREEKLEADARKFVELCRVGLLDAEHHIQNFPFA